MEDISKETLEKNLVFVWHNAKEVEKNGVKMTSIPYRIVLGSFTLSSDGIKAFDKIINELTKIKETRLKFSNKRLEDLINYAVVALLPVDDTEIMNAARKQVNMLFEILANLPSYWKIVVPITNLVMKTNELRIGQVRFFSFKIDDESMSQLLTNAPKGFRKRFSKKIVVMVIGSIGDEKPPSRSRVFAKRVCAEVVVSAADETRAIEIGIRSIQLALDILRFYRFAYFSDPFSSNFDIQGDICEEPLHMILVTPEKNAHFHQSSSSYLGGYTTTA